MEMMSALLPGAMVNVANTPAEAMAGGLEVPIPFDLFVRTAAPDEPLADRDGEEETDGTAGACLSAMGTQADPAPVAVIPSAEVSAEVWVEQVPADLTALMARPGATGAGQPSTHLAAADLPVTAASTKPAGSDLRNANMDGVEAEKPELAVTKRGESTGSEGGAPPDDAPPAPKPAGSVFSFHVERINADESAELAAAVSPHPSAVSGPAFASSVVPTQTAAPGSVSVPFLEPMPAAAVPSPPASAPPVRAASSTAEVPTEKSGGRGPNVLFARGGPDAAGLQLRSQDSVKSVHGDKGPPEKTLPTTAVPSSGASRQMGDDRALSAGEPAQDQLLRALEAPGLIADGATVGPPATPQTPSGSAPAQSSAHGLPDVPPDRAGQIGRQLATSLTDLSGRSVEVTLAPEELGRVTMTIASSDGGLTLTMVAERSETLELMRRNIDQLAQEFRDLGFGTLNFAFSQGGQPSRDMRASHGDDDGQTVTPAQPGQTSPAHRQSAAIQTDILDLRV